jgi:L-alanine-DL-glutamate epimerase-like enolase superfamily enzyme
MTASRRDFLRGAACAGAAVQATLVGGTESFAGHTFPPPVIGMVKSGIPVLAEKTGLRIVAVESHAQGPIGLVRVRADDGAEGWGQLSPYDADLSARILHRKIASHALGRDPADIDLIVDRCIEANYKYPWSFVCRALTGLETAVWDLLGKREGKPVCELLGGRPRKIPVYGSSMSRTITPRDEGERLARLRDKNGYRAFKVRVGKVNGHDADEWPGRTEELIPAVREAVGTDVRLMADANSCYSPPKAIEVGRLLERYDYTFFEEPCPYWELEWTARVAEVLDIPVAGGEQDNDLAQFRRMIRMRAVDLVQPDICYIGGLLRALSVARMAAEMGVPCVPHSANVSLVTVFTLHLMAAIPNAGTFVEFSIEESDWIAEWLVGMYHPALEVVDGEVAVPADPGWGVEVDSGWLERAEREVSEA